MSADARTIGEVHDAAVRVQRATQDASNGLLSAAVELDGDHGLNLAIYSPLGTVRRVPDIDPSYLDAISEVLEAFTEVIH